MENIFFDNWESLYRTFIITILAYISMVFFLRISGKRTLSKMNAFDFVVTVALGSALATVALNREIALAEGALVFFLIIFLQYLITWLSVRHKNVKKFITSQPALLLYKGEPLQNMLRQERISMHEIYEAVRKAGFSTLDDIDAIVLETTGDVTVIGNVISKRDETLNDVKNYPPA